MNVVIKYHTAPYNAPSYPSVTTSSGALYKIAIFDTRSTERCCMWYRHHNKAPEEVVTDGYEEALYVVQCGI